LAAALVRAAIEKKAFDIAILDMRDVVGYTDLFVICSARNRRQVQAIAEATRKAGKELTGAPPKGMEGEEAARWVLVDFGAVVVHVFDEPLRGFYDLDGLWGDAPRVTLPGVELPIEPMGAFA
jgi:ribosome-associated protein